MLGCGHNLTIAEDVNATGKLQIFGGSNVNLGTTGEPAATNVVVKSGSIESVYGGNFAGTFTGNAKVEISGTAKVTNAYPCSQSYVGDSSVCSLTVDGTGGAEVKNINAGWTGSYSSVIPGGVGVTVTLKNVKSGSDNVLSVDLLSKNNGASNLNIEGGCQVCMQVRATNLNIKDNATLTCGGNKDGANGTNSTYAGKLEISKDLTLGTDASYIHAGSGAQSVGGNIVLTGNSAAVTVYKQNFASAPVALNIGGSFTGSGKLNLELFNDDEVGAKDGDVLLTFTDANNANAANYNSYVNPLTKRMYECRKDGGSIMLAGITTAYLPYYEPVGDQQAGADGLYKYVEIGRLTESDGGSHVVYRKIDGGKLYPADANGNITGPEITYDMQLAEKPQPSTDYPVDYNDYSRTMVRIDEIGKYRITAAAGTNSTGIGLNDLDDGTASGVPGKQIVNIDDKGINNASWANLKQTNENCTIHKAYLVMTTTLINGGTAAKRSKTVNDTMRLIAPNGDEMLSNGYLPEGTVNAANSQPMTTNAPVLLYDTARDTLGEAMVITDVTDFVKEHGYGKYYGADLPYDEATDIDAAIAWRLIVVEEDPTLDFLRKVAIQVGPITNSGEASVELLLGGFTTPGITLSNFGGQILLIGSDNTTKRIVGGGTGSNLHNTFYPDSTKTEYIIVASNDGRTPEIERPIKEDGSIGYWSQGFMDIDGKRLDKDEVSHMSDTGGMGIDMSLLNISNIPNNKWDTEGGHNLYLTDYSPSIKLTTKSDQTGIGYIDTLAISTDLETPDFVTSIIHTDLTPTEGVDIIAGETVIVKATAENITKSKSSVIGSFNTKVIVTVDDSLTNVRDITAVFQKAGGTPQTVVGDYDAAAHTITFDFGMTKRVGEHDYPLYNEAGDNIEISFKADTDKNNPTINNKDVCYTNSIVVTGKDVFCTGEAPYKETDVVPAYAHDSDSFDTYLMGDLKVSKTISGNSASAVKDFTFTVKLTDATVNGNFGDMSFTNGEATFTLKAGESKTAVGLTAGVGYNVAESDNDGYTVTVNGGTETEAAGTITADTVSVAAFKNYKNIEVPPTPHKPNVKIIKSSVHTIDATGNHISYTLTAVNSGDATAYGVFVKDYIPANTQLAAVDTNGKYGVQNGKEYVSWFIESLGVGESCTMTFTVTVGKYTEETVIHNRAYYDVTDSTNEPDYTKDPSTPTNETTDSTGTGLGGNCSATLNKVDSQDNTTVLSGARFQLYRIVGDTVQLIGIYSTDKNGQITVNNLPAGNYYWVEIGSAAGYKLDATKHTFTLKDDGTSELTVTNTRTDVPEALNGIDHYAYIIGYPDGYVRPTANITRAEVATIFFRLLTDEVRDQYMTKENSFSDVNDNNWFCRAVSTMAKMGIVNGYPNGTFNPNGPITRAEFAAIAARFDANGNSSTASFYDIYEHWGCKEISIAANNGWVLGYEDGTFRPDQLITRAEAMAMVDRVLQRVPQYTSDLLDEMVEWPDNMDEKKWYYFYVQEAKNSHYLIRKTNGYETWTELRPVRDWTELER